MSGPQVAIDLGRIERNARAVVERAALSGIKVFGVTKGSCGLPQVARAMLRGGVSGLAESRFENIRRLRESGIGCPIMLLRSPPIARVEEVVRTVDISLQSELEIIRELSRIAQRIGRVHDIMLMVDLGDLREGIWPNDLLPTVERVLELPGVRIAGLGTNLTCFGAIMPTEDNLNQLVAYAYKVERLAGISLDWVSGAIRRRCRCCWKTSCLPASTICASARRSCRAATRPSGRSPGKSWSSTPSGSPAT
jgi:predicted amino acid racemase